MLRMRKCCACVGAEASATAEQPWEIKMLYDGDCPLCMREVNMLRRRDAGIGRIEFVDIASPDYDASANAGISFEQVSFMVQGVTLVLGLLGDVSIDSVPSGQFIRLNPCRRWVRSMQYCQMGKCSKTSTCSRGYTKL